MFDTIRSVLSYFSDEPFAELRPDEGIYDGYKYYQVLVGPLAERGSSDHPMSQAAAHGCFIVTARNLYQFYLHVLPKWMIVSVGEFVFTDSRLPYMNCSWFGEPLSVRTAGLVAIDLVADSVGGCHLMPRLGVAKRPFFSEIKSAVDFYFDCDMSETVAVNVMLGSIVMPLADYFSLTPGSTIEIPCDGSFPVQLNLDGEVVAGVATVEKDRLILEITAGHNDP